MLTDAACSYLHDNHLIRVVETTDLFPVYVIRGTFGETFDGPKFYQVQFIKYYLYLLFLYYY